VAANPELQKGVAVCAIGGFGRGQLFPYSDVDLMFCIDKSAEKLGERSPSEESRNPYGIAACRFLW